MSEMRDEISFPDLASLMNWVTSFTILTPSSIHLSGLNEAMLEVNPASQSAMVYLAKLTKAMASLIIDEISLLSTSVLIFSPRLTKSSISLMQEAKSPTLVSMVTDPAPQSGRAV